MSMSSKQLQLLWNGFFFAKTVYWPFRGGASFVDRLCYLCLVYGMLSRRLVAALWSPEGKGLTSWLLFVMVTFPFGILGQVWYLIVSIPDHCCLSYFAELTEKHLDLGPTTEQLTVTSTI